MNPISANKPVDLSGRVALVTGAASGLGLRFADVLADAGAAVVLTGRRLEKLEAVREQIVARGGKAIALALDMRDAESIEQVVAAAEATLGPVDVLINNAGVAAIGDITTMSVAAIDEMLDTNLRGPLLMARAIGRRLIALDLAGRIVNISSIAAYHTEANSRSTVYSITKSGVLRLTENLAMEWARHRINVNAIAPGLMRTEMLEANRDYIEKRLKELPRQRIGMPGELDSTLLYLVSPASEFVTGICIRVDDAQTPR